MTVDELRNVLDDCDGDMQVAVATRVARNDSSSAVSIRTTKNVRWLRVADGRLILCYDEDAQ